MNQLCGAKCESVNKQQTVEDHVYELLDELSDRITRGNQLVGELEDILSKFLYDSESTVCSSDKEKSPERPTVVDYMTRLIDNVNLHNNLIETVLKRTIRQ